MTRSIACCWLAIFAAGCSDHPPEPWSPAQMRVLSEQFRHIAEAYAIVDVCMPMIESNKDAKREVISEIAVRHYSRLATMDTEAELAKFIAHHRKDGGSDEQAAELERIYRESHEAAARLLTSLDSCTEATTDYANTILNTRVQPEQ